MQLWKGVIPAGIKQHKFAPCRSIYRPTNPHFIWFFAKFILKKMQPRYLSFVIPSIIFLKNYLKIDKRR